MPKTDGDASDPRSRSGRLALAALAAALAALAAALVALAGPARAQSGASPDSAIRSFPVALPDGTQLRVAHGPEWCRVEPSGSRPERDLLASWSGPGGRLLAGFVDCAVFPSVLNGTGRATVTAQLRRIDLHRDQVAPVPGVTRERFVESLRQAMISGIDYSTVIERANRHYRSLGNPILEQTTGATMGLWRHDRTAAYLAGSLQIRSEEAGAVAVDNRALVQGMTVVGGWSFAWAVYMPYVGQPEVFERAYTETRRLVELLIRENESGPRLPGMAPLPPGATPIPQRR